MFLKHFAAFTKDMEELIAHGAVTTEQCDYYLTQISFLQNERIAHLHVLIGILLAELLSMLIMYIHTSPATIMLFILFLLLLIPYIFHYYKLENLIQKWYLLYNEMVNITEKVMDSTGAESI